jgi:hypothetical protein
MTAAAAVKEKNCPSNLSPHYNPLSDNGVQPFNRGNEIKLFLSCSQQAPFDQSRQV